IAPAVCALAADGVRSGGWGGGWEAPAMPLGSPPHLRLRHAHRSLITAEDGRALLAALAAADSCERQLAAALLGQADKSLAPEVARHLASSSATERAAALVALGTMEGASEAAAVQRLLADPEADVRANAAWALGRME